MTEHILKHGSSLELRALLIRGLSDREVNQVNEEPQQGQEALR